MFLKLNNIICKSNPFMSLSLILFIFLTELTAKIKSQLFCVKQFSQSRTDEAENNLLPLNAIYTGILCSYRALPEMQANSKGPLD